MNLYKIVSAVFFFWECWCMDPRHPGDEPDCPRHGIRAFLTRFLVACALTGAALLALLAWKVWPL